MIRRLFACALLTSLVAPAPAQPRQPVPQLSAIDALRADFAARAGGINVYFQAGSAVLSPQARTALAAQALWIRTHPEVVVRIEGYGDPADTRDHALASGARRAQQVRDRLLMLGIPAAQVTAMSWGKERPGIGRAVTVLVR